MGVQTNQMYGRILITTSKYPITEDNVREVLADSYLLHQQNRQRIKFLIEYEKSHQPLQRDKKVRADINIECVDSIASEIITFKTGYKWGNPITYKQRATFDANESDAAKDNKGISMINEMLNEVGAFSEDAALAYYVETCGVGYQLVDIKKDFENVSTFDLITLDPLNTFVVYDNSIYHRPQMGVTYTTDDSGIVHFTCLTAEQRFEIIDAQKFGERSGEKNPMGRVNIVEFVRSNDRMGAFEREISAIDALNILESDFVNNVAQDTQALWWGDNLELPDVKDAKGKPTGRKQVPRSGGWILTSSGESKKASVQPLVVQTQYNGILADIKYQRDVIKQRCFVPINASAGGGSTGTAMSMSAGWENAEVQAQKEESFMRRGKMDIARLILIAINESTDTPVDSPARKVRISDIQPNILRDRNYDMATKANTLATLLNCGIEPSHAIAVIKLFSDVNLVVNDSKPYLDLYYEAKRAAISRTLSSESDSEHALVDDEGNLETHEQDISAQSSNSPIIGGLRTATGGRHGKGVTKR